MEKVLVRAKENLSVLVPKSSGESSECWISSSLFHATVFSSIEDILYNTRIHGMYDYFGFVFPQAEKAEGFINLTDFVIDRATECKKK